MKLNLLKIGAVIFGIFVLGIIVNSCQVEDLIQDERIENVNDLNYKRKFINFDEFKKEVKNSNKVANEIFSRNRNNYITSIDSSKILVYENESLTSYTFKINTSNSDASSFDNLVIKATL